MLLGFEKILNLVLLVQKKATGYWFFFILYLFFNFTCEFNYEF